MVCLNIIKSKSKSSPVLPLIQCKVNLQVGISLVMLMHELGHTGFGMRICNELETPLLLKTCGRNKMRYDKSIIYCVSPMFIERYDNLIL